jgi:signal transduction histidine kinase
LIRLVENADSPRRRLRVRVERRSDPSRSRIGVEVDAAEPPAVYRGHVRVRSLLGRHGVDALVVVLALAAVVEAWVDSDREPRLLTVPLALAWTLPLLLRRRFPLVAPVVVFLVLAGEALVSAEAVTESQTNTLAILAAFGIAGAHPDLRAAVAGAAAGYAALGMIASFQTIPFEAVAFMLIFSAATWGIGRLVGERGRRALDLEERADRLERAHAEAVAGERATIARELHDVIAHSVSVMTVQAGAARLLLDEEPARAKESLLAVEETGRQALGEMRRLLGILRGDEHETQLTPQPGIAEIDALVEHVRAAGLPVDVVVEGEPKRLPPGIDLAAYRVVQEALTNALKHAGAARAQVAIRYGAAAIELAVTNDGRVRRNGGVGHGLVGMRERVTLYGGELEAGPGREGGYAVRATLPIETRAA